MDNSRERLTWLALGASLANNTLLSRVLTCHINAFRIDPKAKQLFESLSQDKASVARVLRDLGVDVNKDQTAAQSVVEYLVEVGNKERNKSIANRIQTELSLGGDLESILKKHIDYLEAEKAKIGKVAG